MLYMCLRHTNTLALKYFQNCFLRHVIGTYNASLAWTAHFPDSNTCDFYFWGPITFRIYQSASFPKALFTLVSKSLRLGSELLATSSKCVPTTYFAKAVVSKRLFI